MAATWSGWLWPILVTRTPEVKSMKTLPSTSVTRAPLAWSQTTGTCSLIERGSYCCDNARYSRDFGPGISVFTHGIMALYKFLRSNSLRRHKYGHTAKAVSEH